MQIKKFIWKSLAGIGILKLSYVFSQWTYWKLWCKLDLSDYKHGYVLITDATDNLGYPLAKYFLSKGFRLILLSEESDQLLQSTKSLKSLYPASSIVQLRTDFSNTSSPCSSDSSLLTTIEKYPISIIINNRSFFPSSSSLSQSPEETEKTLKTNIYPSLFISHKLIPVFLQRFEEQKLRSLVLSFGSFSETNLFPSLSVYAASQRFNFFVSEGLRFEYDQIDFAMVKKCDFIGRKTEKEKSFWQVEEEEYVGSVMNGLRTGVNYGHWKMKVYGITIGSFPYLFTVALIRNVFPAGFLSKFFK